MTNGKNLMNDVELEMVSGGLSWKCTHSGIGTENEKIVFETVLWVDKDGTPMTKTETFYGRGCSAEAQKFMAGRKDDIFNDPHGKAFKL